MKNFDWTRFTIKIAIKAKPEIIYNAWAKSSEIEKWFLKKAIYFDADNQPVSGNTSIENGYFYEWSWYAQDFSEKGKINSSNGRDFIQFTFAGACIVDISLAQKEGHTIVTITQSNIPTDDDSKKSIRLGCESGWTFYLVNLKSIMEGGLDLRNKDPDFVTMVNN